MKKNFYIIQFLHRQDNGDPYWYAGYSSSGCWTRHLIHAKRFDTEQEAIWKIEELIKDENSEYEIVTTYS